MKKTKKTFLILFLFVGLVVSLFLGLTPKTTKAFITSSFNFSLQTPYTEADNSWTEDGGGRKHNNVVTVYGESGGQWGWVLGRVGSVSAKISGTMQSATFTFTVNVADASSLQNNSEWGTGKVYFTVKNANGTVIKSTSVACDMQSTAQKNCAVTLTDLTYSRYTIETTLKFSDTGTFSAYAEYTGKWVHNVTFTEKPITVYSLSDNYVSNANNTYYYKDKFSFAWTDGESSIKTADTLTANGCNATINVQPKGNAELNGDTLTKGKEIETENTYFLTFKTSANRVIENFNVVLDKTAPVITVKDKEGKDLSDGSSFADDITVSISDLSPTTATYDGKEQTLKSFTISPEDLSNDEVVLTVTDILGHKKTITLYRYIESFSLSDIQSSYKATRWYNVELPKSRYNTEHTGLTEFKYSFSTYEKAFAFAKEMEYTHIVQPTANGWVYSTADNLSGSQEYVVEAVLDMALSKWAKTFISSAQSYSTGKNNYYIDNGELINNAINVPSSVAEAVGFSTAYFIRSNYVFYRNEYRLKNGIEQTLSVKYVGDVVNGSFTYQNYETNIEFVAGNTWKEYLVGADCEYQGYWLITEKDSIYNETTYLVYYDLTAPDVSLTGTRGDGSTRTFSLTEYNGAIQFTSLEFGATVDNLDSAENVLILVNGRGINSVIYTSFDDIPVLTAGNGFYGKYDITVYDRSNNTEALSVVIAPETLPTWTYSSLTNETRLRISFNTNYNLNSFADIKIYRVSSAGVLTLIDKDDDGTPINQLTTEYYFYTGGKYQAVMTDIFGRTVTTEPIFYQKGLPSGTLKGVTDGGITNKNVSFSCSYNLITRLYIIEGDTRTLAPNSLYNETVEDGNKVITILASEETSKRYLLSLHNNLNEELFVEYTFEIDTICADVLIFDLSGNPIEYDGYTTNGFYVTSIETVRLSYYVNEANNGLNVKSYKLNDRIYSDGTYYFTIVDRIGNTKTFTILVDTVVNFSVGGSYAIKDGKIVANNHLTLTVMERCNTFVLSNGTNNYSNGETLTVDGLYNLYAVDLYGNILNVVILIDTVTPALTLEGVTDGGITKETVKVTFEDGATGILTNSKGLKLSDIESGQTFTNDGSYYVVVTDYAGNVSMVTFYIQTKIEITANVLNNQITSDPVNVSFSSDVALTIKRDGKEIEYSTRFVDIGLYEIKAIDTVGNELVFRFRIIEKLYREYTVELSEGWTIANVIKDGGAIEPSTKLKETGAYVITITDGTLFYDLIVQIDCTPPTVIIEITGNSAKFSNANKDNITAVLFKDGKEVKNYTFGANLTESGFYKLELVDELGNTNVYEFEIPYKLNGFAIALIIVFVIIVAIIVVFIIKSRKIKI